MTHLKVILTYTEQELFMLNKTNEMLGDNSQFRAKWKCSYEILKKKINNELPY